MEECTHEKTEIRRMSHCNQIKHQCLYCGESVGNPIKHDSISLKYDELNEFDVEFRDLMRERRSEIYRQEQEQRHYLWQQGALQRKEEYAEYLSSPQWRDKRKAVIARENGICQGCRIAKIDEVHHLTYDNRGDELLFQLVGLCKTCHRKAHNEH
jgi:hypothetical protein